MLKKPKPDIARKYAPAGASFLAIQFNTTFKSTLMRNIFVISAVFASVLFSGSASADTLTNSQAVQKASAGMSYMKVLVDRCQFTPEDNALFESIAMFAMAGLRDKGPVLTPDIEQGGIRGALAAESTFNADPAAACKEARERFADFAKLAKTAPSQKPR